MRQLYYGDNLQVMAQRLAADSVDLVYLDPPFNSGRGYHLSSEAAGGRVAAFDDLWRWRKRTGWECAALLDGAHRPVARLMAALGEVLGQSATMAYLVMMAERLLEVYRVLKPSGSLYLHCDPSASHYLKILLDAVFGQGNFRNEIIWHYYNKYSAGKKVFPRSFDQIFFYTMSGSYTFHPPRELREKPVKQLLRENVAGVLKNKKDAAGKTMTRLVHDRKVDAVWRIPCVQYASPDYTGYPTQKPLRLLERIVEASSNPGDVVLDPFCGCGTALHAAENLGRSWIGIDATRLAIAAVGRRFAQEFPQLSGAGLLDATGAAKIARPKPAEVKKRPRRTAPAHGREQQQFDFANDPAPPAAEPVAAKPKTSPKASIVPLVRPASPGKRKKAAAPPRPARRRAGSRP